MCLWALAQEQAAGGVCGGWGDGGEGGTVNIVAMAGG